VRAGDSLWSISEQNLAKLGYRTVTPAWHAVYAANQKAIGSSPGSLSVGTRLCLPSA
jgi:Tfp pilus assembly protein FimV